MVRVPGGKWGLRLNGLGIDQRSSGLNKGGLCSGRLDEKAAQRAQTGSAQTTHAVKNQDQATAKQATLLCLPISSKLEVSGGIRDVGWDEG